MSMTLSEIKGLFRLALGTPETVNFHALRSLLAAILRVLVTVYRRSEQVGLPQTRDDLHGVDSTDVTFIHDMDSDFGLSESNSKLTEVDEVQMPTKEKRPMVKGGEATKMKSVTTSTPIEPSVPTVTSGTGTQDSGEDEGDKQKLKGMASDKAVASKSSSARKESTVTARDAADSLSSSSGGTSGEKIAKTSKPTLAKDDTKTDSRHSSGASKGRDPKAEEDRPASTQARTRKYSRKPSKKAPTKPRAKGLDEERKSEILNVESEVDGGSEKEKDPKKTGMRKVSRQGRQMFSAEKDEGEAETEPDAGQRQEQVARSKATPKPKTGPGAPSVAGSGPKPRWESEGKEDARPQPVVNVIVEPAKDQQPITEASQESTLMPVSVEAPSTSFKVSGEHAYQNESKRQSLEKESDEEDESEEETESEDEEMMEAPVMEKADFKENEKTYSKEKENAYSKEKTYSKEKETMETKAKGKTEGKAVSGKENIEDKVQEKAKQKAEEKRVEMYTDDRTPVDSGSDHSVRGFMYTPVPDDAIRREDLDDLDKRLKLLEFDMSKMSSAEKRVSTTDRNIDNLEKKERSLQKYIEMVEKENDERTGSILKDIRELKKQLQYLPNPKELHKSFFPSWKMIEDGICAHPTLKQNIDDAKQDQGTASKQLSKFLGPSGPSERLLEAFRVLSGLIEQGRVGGFDQLAREVAEAKLATMAMSRKKGHSKYPVEGISYKKTVVLDESMTSGHPTNSVTPDASNVNSETELGPVNSSEALQEKTATDASYMGFKVARLVEDTVGIRKELNDMQLWKDKLNIMEDDMKELADMLMTLRRDLDVKSEKDHDVMMNLQMDVNELHREICGLETKKATQARKIEMDNVKKGVQEIRYNTVGEVVIDREARIRTQQLQMQLNSVHQMLGEIEARLPADFSYSPTPGGMPEDMMHPWGTGRDGPGTSTRAGAGTTAIPTGPTVSTQKPVTVASPSPPRPATEARPAPLGRGSEESVMKVFVSPQYCVVGTGDKEERSRTQFAITRLNQEQSNMNIRLEACQNQQTTELRRLQDLMTRMHKEYMVRCTDLEEQVAALTKESSEDSAEANSMAVVPVTTEERVHSASPRGSSAKPLAVSLDTMMEMRKELMGYMKALRKRVRQMEEALPYMGIPDLDAALVKKPILHRFQCLSCDKRVELSQARGDGLAPNSVVPELPRLPLLSSPPRLRMKSQAIRAVPMDSYTYPRQCGGSYTSSSRPRRIHFFSDLGEVIDAPKLGPTEKVDVRGSDGHIYKGQIKMSNDVSNNFYLTGISDRLPLLP